MSNTDTADIINAVHIVETGVCGISAFHAHCPACGWRCHRRAHDDISTAQNCAARHNDNSH